MKETTKTFPSKYIEQENNVLTISASFEEHIETVSNNRRVNKIIQEVEL